VQGLHTWGRASGRARSIHSAQLEESWGRRGMLAYSSRTCMLLTWTPCMPANSLHWCCRSVSLLCNLQKAHS
jgi:hypothetical protein